MTEPFELWLEYEHDDTILDMENGFFNMIIELPSGEEYALMVWTFKYLDCFRDWCRMRNQYLDGKYAIAPNLFVERMDRQHIIDVVSDLLTRNELKSEWLMP